MTCRTCQKIRAGLRSIFGGSRLKFDLEVPFGSEQMTVVEFRRAAMGGACNDYDGYGRVAKKLPDGRILMCHDYVVLPSKVNSIPKEATHIVWFNK